MRNDNEKITFFVVPSKEDLDKMIKYTIKQALIENQIESPTLPTVLSSKSKSNGLKRKKSQSGNLK
jgi:hypothetical protein